MVLDRGAISFNFPESWIVAGWDPLELHDNEPPDDKARLSLSYWRLPTDVDWHELPLAFLLEQATTQSSYTTLSRGDVVRAAREDVELLWVEQSFMDPHEKRPAQTRIALARSGKGNIHVLITLDFWPEDREWVQVVWDEALRSLQLGRHITDPTKGITLH
jgi:hypothetical protein